MANENTAHLNLPLPHPDNLLEGDVFRLRDALSGIDAHAQRADEKQAAALAALEDHIRDFDNPHQTPLPPLPPLATTAKPGLVQIGDGLAITAKGVLSAAVSLATKSKPGLVQIGEGLAITTEGVLSAAVCGVLPGSVLAFSGTFGGDNNRHPIPRGGTRPDSAWILCDGGSDGAGGNVPDLRGRMIMGAGGSYAAGATGGAATHKHSVTGTVGATTLTEAQLASHRHAILTTTGGVNGGEYNPFGRGFTTGTNGSSIQSTGGSKSHTHALTASSGAAASLPPYYALAYIIRIT